MVLLFQNPKFNPTHHNNPGYVYNTEQSHRDTDDVCHSLRVGWCERKVGLNSSVVSRLHMADCFSFRPQAVNWPSHSSIDEQGGFLILDLIIINCNKYK